MARKRQFVKITDNIFQNKKRPFAERELEKWLMKNLNKLEKGLVARRRQFILPDPDFKNRRGIVDIVAVDAKDQYVLIEVKDACTSFGPYQLLRYKSFFIVHYKEIPRLVLIANKISEKTLLVCLKEGIEVWLAKE